VVLSEELCILSSCFLSPMSKNSVLEELRVRRLCGFVCMILRLAVSAEHWLVTDGHDTTKYPR